MGEKQLLSKPEVFEYTDYRQFLGDLYDFLKATKPQFSYRYFSQRAGFSSPNFLKLVIDGKRNLTKESVDKFAKGLKLTDGESHFFELLVNFNQSSKPMERAQFAEQMFQKLGRRKIQSLSSSELNYYAHWYNIAVRELVALPCFKEDPFWIANQFDPALNPNEVKKSLESLEELGLIERNAQGNLQLGQVSVNTENEVANSMVALYHKKMMELASESIDRVPREERELSALCVPISDKTAQIIKDKVQKFREEILVLASEDNEAERVYQLNLQLFPITKKAGE